MVRISSNHVLQKNEEMFSREMLDTGDVFYENEYQVNGCMSGPCQEI